MGSCGGNFSRPFGTGCGWGQNPALKRQAIVGQPFRRRPGAGAYGGQAGLGRRGVDGFTLIELLVVISIIGVLAAFVITVGKGVARTKYISVAKSEMAAIETGLESYKADHGFYPPSNPNTNSINYLVNPLYFELEGVIPTNVATVNPSYTTLDGVQTVSSNQLTARFGLNGLVNCARGSGEDAVPAKTYLHDLKANQVGTNNNVAILITSVGGPDQNYQPLKAPNFNPWRYSSVNPTNNPGSYDLYVQLQINGKKYLVCNWSKQNAINSPLP